MYCFKSVIDSFCFPCKVKEVVQECTCEDVFPVEKIADGKYKIGENRVLIFVRVMRNHVMVRVGGGWDTLENYIQKHDPCRAGGIFVALLYLSSAYCNCWTGLDWTGLNWTGLD